MCKQKQTNMKYSPLLGFQKLGLHTECKWLIHSNNQGVI